LEMDSQSSVFKKCLEVWNSCIYRLFEYQMRAG
jgi:hypothetical protein